MPTFQQLNVWRAIDHASEYATAKRLRHERGAGGHAGRLYRSSAAMFDDRMRGMTDWDAAVYEARFRFNQVFEIEQSALNWALSWECESGDIPF